MVRQRQDLDRTTAAERDMNDRTAEDVYTNLRLGYIRDGTDPNATEPDVIYEGYEAPTFDAKRGAKIAKEEEERCREIRKRRLEALERLRNDKEHKKLSAFDRIVRETYQWVQGHVGVATTSGGGGGMRRASSVHSHHHHLGSQSAAADKEELSSQVAAADACVDRLTVTPSYLKGKLRDYQLEGVNWLLNLFDTCVNGILADEMGLGKTFQTIATISYLKFTHGLPGPHLVVVPKSVLGNWYREFRKWCPALDVYRFHSGSDMRPAMVKGHLKEPIKHDVILTTYEMILYEQTAFSRIQWQFLMVDEAHKLKNDEGQVHTALAKLRTWHRLLITGTPLQNDLGELRALLHFLSPELFSDADSFNKWFDASSGDQDKDAISRMHLLLQPMMLRRLKKDVSTGIPPKREIYVTCHMTKKQKDWYLSVMAKNAEAINRGGNSNIGQLDNILMHLRKVVNHPYLMPGAEEGPPFKTDEKLINDAGKMIVLDKLLSKLKADVAGAHKVLIFSQMTRMVDVLEDYCIFRGWQYCRLDGSTSSYDRDRQMAEFNNPTSPKFIFLLSTRAGGLGINLQAANNVILYDSDWNPQMDLQAQDRAHRIGQTRTVRVYRFITNGTVEERIYKRALKKLYLDAMVVQQGRVVGQDKKASKEELLSMVKFGAEAIFKSRTQEVTDADIDRLLKEGEETMDKLHEELKGTQQASLANFKLGVDDSNIYDFEGVNYKQGVQSKMLHITLPEPISQEELHKKCAAFGDVIKTAIHPNLKEALVSFRFQSGASEALQHLEYKCVYAAKDAQIVSSEIVNAIVAADVDGEELGRGKRKVRAPMEMITEEQLDKLQKQTKIPPPKLPKKPSYPAYQLFNVARLEELHNTEVALILSNWKRSTEQARHSAAVSPTTTGPGVSPTASGATGGGLAEAAAAAATTAAGTDSAAIEETLNDDELAERDRLIEEGFPTWTHDEFRRFLAVLCSGKIDRTDYGEIAEAMGGTKTKGEVQDYSKAFWERGPTILKNFSSIEKRIQKGQRRIEQEKMLLTAAQWKVEAHDELVLSAKAAGHKDPEVDRAMFLMCYDNRMKMDGLHIDTMVKEMPANRYDVFYQTRERSFFENRLRALVQSVKHEYERDQIDKGLMPAKQRKRPEKTAMVAAADGVAEAPEGGEAAAAAAEGVAASVEE